ncbi:MAG: acyl--CoA ligase, partial [Blastomonas sp.]|nr:acyl--CoA ligase [Blastomonas sp.]
MSLKQIESVLCAPGQPFEIETVDVEGIPTRCWKNAPPSLAALAQAARGHGERTFLVYEDERVSYEGWFRATAMLAHALQQAGIGKGDRVALAMRNLPEWPVAFFAIVSLGAIAVPLNAWWTGGELAYGIADSGAKMLIADAERIDRLEPHLAELASLEKVLVSRSLGDLPPQASRLEDIIGSPGGYGTLASLTLPDAGIAPDDAATIFYTSGTTGNPKGALGSHRNMTTNILTTAYAGVRASLRRGETPPAPEPAVMLTVIPLFHVTACSAGMTGIMF